jgi:hypothetical protein
MPRQTARVFSGPEEIGISERPFFLQVNCNVTRVVFASALPNLRELLI